MKFDSDVLFKEVGKRFNLLRRLLGKSLEVMAVDLQSSVQKLEAIEKGEKQDVLSGIEHLDEVYGVNFNWLITGQGKFFFTRGAKVDQDIYDLVVLLPWIEGDDNVFTVPWFVEHLEDPERKKELFALLPQFEKRAMEMITPSNVVALAVVV